MKFKYSIVWLREELNLRTKITTSQENNSKELRPEMTNIGGLVLQGPSVKLGMVSEAKVTFYVNKTRTFCLARFDAYLHAV